MLPNEPELGTLWAQDEARYHPILRLGVGLFKPKPHVHFDVHRRRGGEMLPRLLALVGKAVQLAEAEVAVGDEGADLQLLGERKRVAVVAGSRRTVKSPRRRRAHAS
jgi:hypothetical protein